MNTSGRRQVILGTVASIAAGWRVAGATADSPAALDAPAAGDPAGGPHAEFDLWPGQPPGMPAHPPVEEIEERSTDAGHPDRVLRHVSRPRLRLFRPLQPNGAAVVLFPGGGYRHVVVDKEGAEMGRWLAGQGYAAYVVYYRLPGDAWAAGPDVVLADAQRAMRVVRQRASLDGVDAGRIGAMGFSAGGHACANLAARFAARVYEPVDAADTLPARPTCAAPIYPVVSMDAACAHPGSRRELLGPDPSPALESLHSPDRNVPADAPPHFIVHAEDDPAVPVANALQLRAALKARGVPVETHLFQAGGHGFGLRLQATQPASGWPRLWLAWARSIGFS